MEKKVYDEISYKLIRSQENVVDIKCQILINVLFYDIEMKFKKDNIFKVWQNGGVGSKIFLLK